jgi:hypothetical protein
MTRLHQLKWIVMAAIVGFIVPAMLANNEKVPVDFYYLVYFGAVILMWGLYAKQTNLNWKSIWGKNLGIGIILGVVFALILAKNVISRPETEKIAGNILVWSVLWRGLTYGVVDGLFLSSFPWVVTWRTFEVASKPLGQKAGYSFLAWLFVLIITTAYHAGYKDFRSKKIIQPNIGNSIISLSTFLSENPISAPIAHAGMHIAAVIHSPKADLFLPPHR